VFAADQLMYFAEVGGHDSLALGLRHVDYAISRVYWKGDDLLFRPILFTWLAIANRLFSYHHVWWNMANVALHVGVAVALLGSCAIHPRSWRCPPPCCFVLEPPMELVLWNHLGGYLLACLFLAIGLRSFVRRLDGSTTSCAGLPLPSRWRACRPGDGADRGRRRADPSREASPVEPRGDVALLVAPVALRGALRFSCAACAAARLR
jgi:hypothetical protein